MSNIVKGIAWAGAILLNAVLNAYGVISNSSANTMFAVLPVMAVLSLRGDITCSLFGKKEA